MRNRFVRLALVLMLISGLASGALALVDSFTGPRIKAAKEAALQQALTEALPGADKFIPDPAFLGEMLEKDASFAMVKAFYRAVAKDGGPVGVVITVAPRGYSSEIEAMVGVARNGEVQAVRILGQNETPGLGTGVTEEEFLRNFAGARSGQTLAVDKDGGTVTAVAGATISSRATARGVNVALALAKRAGL